MRKGEESAALAAAINEALAGMEEDGTLTEPYHAKDYHWMKRRLLSLFTLFCLAISLPLSTGAVEYTGFSDVDGSNSYHEKYYYLPESLPANSQRPGNIHAGDLMLYCQTACLIYPGACTPGGIPEILGHSGGSPPASEQGRYSGRVSRTSWGGCNALP